MPCHPEMNQEQFNRIQKARIPVNTGGWSDGGMMGLAIGESPILMFDAGSQVMPTSAELTQLREIARKLIEGSFRPQYVEKMMAKPLIAASDGGYNTVLVRKMADGKKRYWQYRRITWSVGPSWMPFTMIKEDWKHLSLEQLAHDYILCPVGGYPEHESLLDKD